MSSVVALLRSRSWPRAVALAVIAVGAAGCSAETTRFNDNPFRSSSNEVTGSVQPSAAPVARVESTSLPPPQMSRPATVAASGGVAGGSRGVASYEPASPEATGSVQAPPVHRTTASGQWSWDGGTAVTVKPGETVHGIARRYGVPANALEQANNLGPNGAIYPGQRLVIPHYTGQASAAPAYRPATAPRFTAPRQVASRTPEPAVGALSGAHGPAGSGVHVVAAGETLSKISKLYGKSVVEIARANRIEPTATLKIGERLTIPGVRTSRAQQKETTKLAQGKPLGSPSSAKTSDKTPDKKVASAAPAESASVVTPAADTPPATTSTVKAADGAVPSFRWPAKGRIIAGYGPKTNGQQNDGINLAVPEGTPVKASEEGVVAYAGNELKGYGNLVLIRHADGYVTAYAHAKELLVKRGDHIKRGQVIAKSGQTGNVDGPQLHFEIRKGPTPLDPLPLLHG